MALPRRIALAGMGPHARHIYYPMLCRLAASYGVEVALVLELEDQRDEVQKYLADKSLQPAEVVYLPASNRDGRDLHPMAADALRRARAGSLWGMVVATEPKAHRIYAQWALDNGVHVLLDKPVTAFPLPAGDPAAALSLVDEYYALLTAAERTGARCMVQTPRRVHPGYLLVRNYLREFLGTFGVPVTYLDIYNADGMWNMPNEFWSRENHPYKYGYGKLMHTGYHHVDLASWLLSVNDELRLTAPDRLEFDSRHQGPADFLVQVGYQRYRELFGDQPHLRAAFDPVSMAAMREFGETDVHLIGQFLRDGAVMTTLSLNLMQTSFSRRSWTALPADTYRANGRIRHERMTVQVAHLLNLQLHSYPASTSGESSGQVADWDHFEVYAFRNSDVVGGQPFERLMPDVASPRARSQFATARQEVLTDFLAGNDDRVSLLSHDLPVKLTAAAYYAMKRASNGQTGVPSIDLHAKGSGWLRIDGARHA